MAQQTTRALRYLGGQTLTNPSNVALAFPYGATTAILAAETGPCYWAIGDAATTSSPGFVATNTYQVLGPLSDDAIAKGVYTSGTCVLHVTYWQGV